MKRINISHISSILALSMLLGLSGCTTMPEIDPSKDGTAQGSDRRTGGGLLEQGSDRQSQVEVMPIGDTQGLQGETLDGSVDPLLSDELIREYSPVVYFEYDQFSVDEESMKTLKHYSDQMVENPSLTVTLEGHTDERGSPSYNLALGEKRAKAVAEVMMLYGVNQDRITLISFGEEQPAEMGHDEAAWSKNRRVELRF